MSDDPNVVESTVWQPDLLKDWDKFKHKYIGEPRVEAAWVDGEVYVRVYVDAKHWIGPEEPPWKVKHAMGFIMKPQDMVLCAENEETPYRRCIGFMRCADGESCNSESE